MRLYLKYFSIQLKSAMQYKASFLLTTLSTAVLTLTVFLGIRFMFARSHTVEGFSYSDVLLCYAVVLLSFTLAECVARGFDTFSRIIGNGEFDRILVRPRPCSFMPSVSTFTNSNPSSVKKHRAA